VNLLVCTAAIPLAAFILYLDFPFSTRVSQKFLYFVEKNPGGIGNHPFLCYDKLIKRYPHKRKEGF
jgi:hypothetical protein